MTIVPRRVADRAAATRAAVVEARAPASIRGRARSARPRSRRRAASSASSQLLRIAPAGLRHRVAPPPPPPTTAAAALTIAPALTPRSTSEGATPTIRCTRPSSGGAEHDRGVAAACPSAGRPARAAPWHRAPRRWRSSTRAPATSLACAASASRSTPGRPRSPAPPPLRAP